MIIRSVSSNVIAVELRDGTMFELYEGDTGELEIRLPNSANMIASGLNVKTIKYDEVWRGSNIKLVGVIKGLQ